MLNGLDGTEIYLTVEGVLRFLHERNLYTKHVGTPQQMTILPVTQYKIGEMERNFFKAKDVEERIGASMYRLMECEVIQYHMKEKSEIV